MKTLISWFAGFFQDQGDRSSSKRLVLYIFTFIFWMEVRANIGGAKIDYQILYATVGVILFLIGAVTSEFIMEFSKEKSKISSTTTTETKVE